MASTLDVRIAAIAGVMIVLTVADAGDAAPCKVLASDALKSRAGGEITRA